jgi:hypothetical protein
MKFKKKKKNRTQNVLNKKNRTQNVLKKKKKKKLGQEMFYKK